MQVLRLGNLLVNELVIGIGDKDCFFIVYFKDDGQFVDYVMYLVLLELLNILFKDVVNIILGVNLDMLVLINIFCMDLVIVFLIGFLGVNQLVIVIFLEML